MGKKETEAAEQLHLLGFFSLTERQISKKEYHKVTVHFAERLFKERKGEECACGYVWVDGW